MDFVLVDYMKLNIHLVGNLAFRISPVARLISSSWILLRHLTRWNMDGCCTNVCSMALGERWINSFLTNITQRVVLDGDILNPVPVKHVEYKPRRCCERRHSLFSFIALQCFLLDPRRHYKSHSVNHILRIYYERV